MSGAARPDDRAAVVPRRAAPRRSTTRRAVCTTPTAPSATRVVAASHGTTGARTSFSWSALLLSFPLLARLKRRVVAQIFHQLCIAQSPFDRSVYFTAGAVHWALSCALLSAGGAM